MCRFVAYMGQNILLSEVLIEPVNSIIKQSLHARETKLPTNGDGFGLGWYVPEISVEPALFTSIFPAWNDKNLLHLAAKIKSSCFFAHVRDAGVGDVSNNNCHPFVYQKWMLMHNGDISHFASIKRQLRCLLDDDIYQSIQGETDSEHFFALFLQLAKGKDLTGVKALADNLIATVHTVNELILKNNQTNDSYLNVCLTDGQRIIACRYCSNQDTPESLHYSTDYQTSEDKISQAVIVSSERLTDIKSQWHTIPKNHLLLVDSNRLVSLCSLN